MAGRALIDAELIEFLRGPVSVFLGTADAMGTPDAARVAGIAAVDHSRLRVLISATADTAVRNAIVGAPAAVLVTDITNYRSIQWKGRVAEAGGQRTPGDIGLIDHLLETFAAASPLVGLEPADCWRMFPVDCAPLVIAVEEMFDQTPGPHAGSLIEARA